MQLPNGCGITFNLKISNNKFRYGTACVARLVYFLVTGDMTHVNNIKNSVNALLTNSDREPYCDLLNAPFGKNEILWNKEAENWESCSTGHNQQRDY